MIAEVIISTFVEIYTAPGLLASRLLSGSNIRLVYQYPVLASWLDTNRQVHTMGRRGLASEIAPGIMVDTNRQIHDGREGINLRSEKVISESIYHRSQSPRAGAGAESGTSSPELDCPMASEASPDGGSIADKANSAEWASSSIQNCLYVVNGQNEAPSPTCFKTYLSSAARLSLFVRSSVASASKRQASASTRLQRSWDTCNRASATAS